MSAADIPIFGRLVPGGTKPISKGVPIIVATTAEQAALDEDYLDVGQFSVVQTPDSDPVNTLYQLTTLGPAVWEIFASGSGGVRTLDGEREVFYANDSGDDANDGSFASPFKTLAKVLSTRPDLVINGGSWVADITGLTDLQTATVDFPPMLGDGSLSAPVSPVHAIFPVEKNFNVLAAPTDFFAGSPILEADVTSTTSEAKTRHTTIFIDVGTSNPNFPLTTNLLLGKILVDANNSIMTVRENGNYDIAVAMDSDEIVFPVQVLEHSAVFDIAGTDPVIRTNTNVTNLQIGGVKTHNDDTISYPHHGIEHINGSAHVSFVACWLQGIALHNVHFLTLNATYVTSASLAAETNATIDGDYISAYRCHFHGAAFDQFQANKYYQWYFVAVASDRIGHTQGPGSNGCFNLVRGYIAAAPAAAIAYYGGAQCFVVDCKIDSARWGVQALGPGQVIVNNVTLTQIGFTDIQARGGGQVIVDGAIAGTAGISCDQQQQLPPATNIVSYPQGTSGSTTRRYLIISVSTNGSKTKSETLVVSDGHATLDGTNFNRLMWVDPLVGDFDHVEVWRIPSSAGSPSTTGLIATVSAGVQTLDDTGLAGDTAEPPYDHVIAWTDFEAAAVPDTDNAPFSSGNVRSRVYEGAIP